MKNRKPLVSVIMPTFNDERSIARAISSIIHQSYEYLEFIIINDGSTDATQKIIQKFSDGRIIYKENKKNQGIIFSLNKAISLAKGKYIARMDADDSSSHDRLEVQVEFMEGNPNTHICGSWAKIEGKSKIKKTPVKDVEIKTHLIFNSSLIHPSAIIRREVFDMEKYPKFLNAEDYGLWVSLAKKFNFHNIPKSLITYTQPLKSKKYRKIRTKSLLQIRKKYLKQLGIKMSHQQVKAFADLSDWKSVNSLEKLKVTYSAILELVQRLEGSSKIDGSMLEEMIIDRWYVMLKKSDKSLMKMAIILYPKMTWMMILRKMGVNK